MKKLICSIVLAVGLTGCSGVIMNARYSSLLDETAAWSKNMADRDKAGSLSAKQKSGVITGNAELWQRFRDARDGKAGE